MLRAGMSGRDSKLFRPRVNPPPWRKISVGHPMG
jgi:hypothetical protein